MSAGEAVVATPRDRGTGTFLFISDILGRKILSPDGVSLGRIADLKVRLGEPYPKVTSLAVRAPRAKILLELVWPDLLLLDAGPLRTRPGAETRLNPLAVAPDEILLREDLLDKQVVDMQGAKIERVNDIHLLLVNAEIRIVHVDFGVRGLLRRLGWLGAVDKVTAWLFAYRTEERLISWKYIQPLSSDPVRKNLKLNVTHRRLHELHPSDLADIIEDLDRRSGATLFRSLDTGTAAQTIEEVEDPKVQAALITGATVERASDILEEMAPDAATDLLADLPAEAKEALIRTMEPSSRRAVVALLKFKEGTAGSLMTKDFFAVAAETTIAQAVAAFRQTSHPLESLAYIYVTDKEGRLAGVSTLRHLLVCDPLAPFSQIMNPRLVTVGPEEDVEKVAEIFRKYKFLAVPVVGPDRKIEGIITLKDVMESLVEG